MKKLISNNHFWFLIVLGSLGYGIYWWLKDEPDHQFKQTAYARCLRVNHGFDLSESYRMDTLYLDIPIDSFNFRIVYNDRCGKWAIKLFDYPTKFNEKNKHLYNPIQELLDQNSYSGNYLYFPSFALMDREYQEKKASIDSIATFYLNGLSTPVLLGKETQFIDKNSAIFALHDYKAFQDNVRYTKEKEAIAYQERLRSFRQKDSIEKLCHQY